MMERTFRGYRRSDGCVGIRNYIAIIPGVYCSEVAARKIAAQYSSDEVVFVVNHTGCGQNRTDMQATLDIFAGMIANGNVFGALIVGLGCEFLTKEGYFAALDGKTDKPVHHLYIQENDGIAKTVEEGKKIVDAMLAEARKMEREEIPLSELNLGLECGGSDPTSGFSSNTVLGFVTDMLIDAGGTAVISETTEAIGAEHILRDRGRTPEIGQQIYDAIVNWERACCEERGEDIRAGNPSPGNQAGGITTLSEKSLGCIHKAGSRPFDGCYTYGQIIREKGLMFLDATPNDIANVTALVACGSQIVAFTTGRGNPVGNPVAPVVKITGNHDTFLKLRDFLDFDTSASISGEKTMEQLADEMLDYFIRVCNGEKTKAEENGCIENMISQTGCYV